MDHAAEPAHQFSSNVFNSLILTSITRSSHRHSDNNEPTNLSWMRNERNCANQCPGEKMESSILDENWTKTDQMIAYNLSSLASVALPAVMM